tara:strand:+ start:21535 stop:22632 length:1098 start_codon:yes stop_codon:yes gene_type:complete
MKKLNFDGPINGLSLGNVCVNFLRELKERDLDIGFFPVGDQGQFEAYDKLNDDFKKWVEHTATSRLKKLKPETPTLKVWHINGSEKVLPNQYLYSFYEVDSPTEEEINIVKLQKHVFFSCSEAAETFKKSGCDNVSYIPLGFDPDFHEVDKEHLKDTIHFGIIGKFERRKNTQAIIQLWTQKYGNNPKYQLSCLVHNPFLKDEQMKQAMVNSLSGQNWSNVNFLPHLRTNSEVNDFLNSIDIDLSGLSNGEGWNLPSFNATALGKWSVVSNCSAHKDWATDENCILVDPVGKQDCYDNFFFKEGMPFNQGQYYKLNGDDILAGFDKAVEKAGQKNTEGTKLRDKFTYSKTVDSILDYIYSDLETV